VQWRPAMAMKMNGIILSSSDHGWRSGGFDSPPSSFSFPLLLFSGLAWV
jgi:hypothetical protein